MININISAHLLSKEEDKWVVVSTQNKDIPISVVVDGQTKNMLLRMQALYNKVPKTIVNFFVKRYTDIVKKIHSLAVPEDFVVPELARTPLFGITKTGEQDTDGISEVEYINNLRLLHFFSTEEMYEAFVCIAEDYMNNPELYYFAYTQYFDYFERVIFK